MKPFFNPKPIKGLFVRLHGVCYNMKVFSVQISGRANERNNI